jgi:hypothetical protein
MQFTQRFHEVSLPRWNISNIAAASFVDAEPNLDTKRVMNSIEHFLSAKTYTVAGASNRQHKNSDKVFRALLAADRETYPLNPAQDEIEGLDEQSGSNARPACRHRDANV